MTTFKEILSDISDASQFSDRESSKSILLNIVSTMSDRASTEIKFNELLEDYRANILKEILRLTECESNKRWTLILFTVDTDGTLLGVISTSFKTLTRLVVTLLFSNSYTHSCVSLVYTFDCEIPKCVFEISEH
jgi:hypothetical protein